MENQIEVLEPQKNQELVVVPTQKVELTQEELDELKHKAEVSSQNFERAKKAELEAKELREKLNTINEVPSGEVFSDEGKVLESKINSLKSELSEVKGELTKKQITENYPQLKDKWEELENFRNLPENKGMNLGTAAKAFLVENGLLEPVRKGLEKVTGGERVPMTSGMTADDVEKLRTTNYKKYKEMVMKDQIKIQS